MDGESFGSGGNREKSHGTKGGYSGLSGLLFVQSKYAKMMSPL